jgi:TetR/AcrR family acrAB operon transcriptional repressor
MRTENEDRADRIINAAQKLIVHYGYDKTTVDEIAREAGISKGAVYLHFDKKEAIFEAVFLQALKNYAEDWMKLIEEDPKGGTIGGMYKNMLYALKDSPFMVAVFKQDRRVLGNYMKRSDNIFKGESFKGTRFETIKLFQEAGVVRKDLDPLITAHIMNMLAYGLVAMDEVMEMDEIPPAETVIEGIADFMDRAMTLPDGGDSNAGKAVLRKMLGSSLEKLSQ